MQQLWFINLPLAQHVSGNIIPIFKGARLYITAYGLQHLMCWLESSVEDVIRITSSTLHTTCLPASQDTSQHIKCWKPYIYGLALLNMGIVLPKTCWATGWLINHNCCIKLVLQITSFQSHQVLQTHQHFRNQAHLHHHNFDNGDRGSLWSSGLYQTPDAAGSPRRFYWTHHWLGATEQMLQNTCMMIRIVAASAKLLSHTPCMP